MRKRYKIAAIVFAVGAAVLIPIFTATEKPEVKSANISAGNIEVYYESSGQIEPKEIYTVPSPMDGAVLRVNVSEGQKVSAGDTLFVMDTSEQERQLAAYTKSAKDVSAITGGSLEESISRQIALQLAQSASCDLYGFNNAIGSGFDSTQNPASEGVDSEAVSVISELEASINNRTSKARSGGTVLAVNISNGEAMQLGQPGVVIGNTDELKITTTVNEREISKISEGMKCLFSLEGESRKYVGSITGLGASAVSVEGILGTDKQVPVYIKPEDGFYALPGRTAKVFIVTNTAEDVVKVPIDAINAEGGVFVIENGDKLSNRQIRTGIANDSFIEVRDGLRVGERVVLNPDAELREGTRVTVK